MQRTVRVLAIVTLLIAACGGGDDGGNDEGGDSGGGSTSIEVTASEFVFTPDFHRVTADSDISFSMTNEGSVEHNWVLLAEGVRVTTAGDVADSDVLAEFLAAGGDTVTGSFTAPGAGTYQVICSIEGHLEAGMEAELVTN